MLATTYPLLDFFWTLLEIFLMVLWIWLAITVFFDIFRSHDMGGPAKAIWVIFVVVFPFLGILVYLIARGGQMHERAEAAAARQQSAFNNYVRHATGSSSTADELVKLAELREKGLLTPEEFEAQKAKILL